MSDTTVGMSIKVVMPSERNVFRTSFAVHVDDSGDVQGLEIITDGPDQASDSDVVLSDVVTFTEGLLEYLRDAHKSLVEGTALNFTDSREV